PLGMNGTKKISDILTDMKAERLNRKQLPVLLSGEELVWLPGFRIAHDFAITTKSTQYIKLTFKPELYG
ncbi:MAG: tRNA lysidine(34) synthetase TilS, partial [Bacteroidia bacterium]